MALASSSVCTSDDSPPSSLRLHWELREIVLYRALQPCTPCLRWFKLISAECRVLVIQDIWLSVATSSPEIHRLRGHGRIQEFGLGAPQSAVPRRLSIVANLKRVYTSRYYEKLPPPQIGMGWEGARALVSLPWSAYVDEMSSEIPETEKTSKTDGHANRPTENDNFYRWIRILWRWSRRGFWGASNPPLFVQNFVIVLVLWRLVSKWVCEDNFVANCSARRQVKFCQRPILQELSSISANLTLVVENFLLTAQTN